MSRKVSGVMAGWLAAASVAVAQTGGSAGTPPAVKGKTLSPYYATASTVDWSGGDEPTPELLPPVPSTPVIPAAPAPAPRAMPPAVVQAAASVPMTAPVPALPASQSPPVAAVPAGPATPALPAAKAPAAPSSNGGSCATCGSAPTCNCNPCGPCGPCGPAGKVWADAELLLWWDRGMSIPPLVTGSPAGTSRSLGGVLGAPGTRILYGDDRVDNDLTPGFRARAGYWLDDCNTCGIEGSFFFLGPDEQNRSFSCLDAPVLARPFIDANPGVPNPFNAQWVSSANPNSELVCYPGVVNGIVDVHTSTYMYGFDANFRENVYCNPDRRVDALVGYRYVNLQDKVEVDEELTVLSNNNPAIPQGTTFALMDRFKTTNQFNGGQIGLDGEYRSGRWYFGGRNLVAFGDNHSDVTISGYTQSSTPGGTPTLNSGGLLTQPTNIGTYTNDRFGVVWEAESIIGYQLTDGIRIFASYSYLYWSNVTRAGDQIDFVVNSSQIAPGSLNGVARPAFVRNDTNFWTQGISFGLEMRY